MLEQYFYFASGIPLFVGVMLAFRLLAEERQNHSMILLKTSPIRDTEIVLGKFFAALTFLAIIFALSIYMPLLDQGERQDHRRRRSSSATSGCCCSAARSSRSASSRRR